ncbi:uncharacterized protein MONBRDRAFT_30650, partial [Monosiga brevicollis MX1]
MGEACELSVCGNERAIVPGLYATYYEGYAFDERRIGLAVPEVAFDLGNGGPSPDVSVDDFSATFVGFVRPTTTGWYRFRLRCTNGACGMYLNQSAYADSGNGLLLVGGESVRVKLEWQHTSYGTTAVFEWQGPYESAAVAQGADESLFVGVPSHALLHEVVCTGGCGGRGCCVAPETCACEPGFGGPGCEVDLDTCGLDAPGGSLVPGGLRARYYDALLEDALVTDGSVAYGDAGVVARVSFDWGYDAPVSNVSGDYWTGVYVGRLVSEQTGWHRLRVDGSGTVGRLYVGGVRLFSWSAAWTQAVYLVGGRSYEVRLDVQDETFTAGVTLFWEGPNFIEHVIPSSALLHYESGFACGCGASGCNGGDRGVCNGGLCVCSGAYVGASCEHFRCRSDECRFTDACHDPAYGSQDAECNGQGRCVAGLCECYDGFVDLSQCTRTGCATDEGCSGHGSCGSDGQCVCEAGYMGEACELSVCGNERAIVPGLYATYYEGYAFDERRIGLAVPEVAFDLGNGGPSPDVSVDDFSATFVGFVRPTTTGWYRFRLRCTNGACGMYLNQSAYADSGNGLLLVGGESVRVKLEWQHTSYGTTAVFEWQ